MHALDSMMRLLAAISAPQADDVNTITQELRRNIFEQLVRSEKHRAGGSLIKTTSAATFKPWRTVCADPVVSSDTLLRPRSRTVSRVDAKSMVLARPKTQQ